MEILKAHLLEILEGTSVYCGLEKVLADIPFEYWGKKRKNLPYTLYELMEHMRLACRDIVDYLTRPDYEAGPWPQAYWPKRRKPKHPQELKKKIDALSQDLKMLQKSVNNEPPLDPLPQRGKQHTLAREIMILSSHMSYHIGQMVVLRRLLGIWNEN